MSHLETVVADLSSQMEAQKKATHELMEKLVSQMDTRMTSWKNEIVETIRLNRPPPPLMDTAPGGSSVNGARQAPPASSHQGQSQPGRRPGKAPVTRMQAAGLEGGVGGDEDSGSDWEPEGINTDWAPRRGRLPAQPHRSNVETPWMRYRYDFPPFDYEQPRLWISRCERFFEMAHIPRIEIMHVLYVNLTGRIGLWFEGYLIGMEGPFQWANFAESVCRRFGGDSGAVMEEFAGFKQVGGVLEFTDKFEEFRSLLIQKHPTLTDSYFLEAYIARLKPNLRCFVTTTQPKTLADAVWFAKQIERGFKAQEQPKPSYHYTPKPTQPTTTFQIPKPYHNPKPTHSQASNNLNSTAKGPEGARVKSQLREQNKCFKCFESWQPGHRCKGSTLNVIEEGEFHDAPEELSSEGQEQEGVDRGEQAEVSLYAMMGGEGLNTIKLLGSIHKQQIMILVDSGSTHSFLDPKLLTQLRMESEKAPPLSVTVANGDQMLCDSVCKGLRWQIQEETFEKDFRLLKLGGVTWFLAWTG